MLSQPANTWFVEPSPMVNPSVAPNKKRLELDRESSIKMRPRKEGSHHIQLNLSEIRGETERGDGKEQR